jgi:hypothetical protein
MRRLLVLALVPALAWLQVEELACWAVATSTQRA